MNDREKAEENVHAIELVSDVTIEHSESTDEKEEHPRIIDLAEHVTSVYGIPYSRAREMMAVGQIFIDGELAQGDKIFFFDEDEIEGKTIEIKSTPQSTKFVYRSEERTDF